MVVTLRREGTDWVLPLSEEIVTQLNLGDTAEVEIKFVGHDLVVSRESEDRRQDFEAALQDTNAQFGEALKRLAQ